MSADKSAFIHIKPSHKGEFTSYCKGKGYNGVTNKCISGAKRNGSPKRKKQAIFAESARKWN